MKVLLSHITGNENTRNAVYGLQRHNMLQAFIVSIAVFRNGWYYSLANAKVFSFLRKRELPVSIKPFVVTYPYKEIGRQLFLKFGLIKNVQTESFIFSSFNEARYIDGKTNRYLETHSNEIDAVYCYEDVAFDTFIKAKQKHIFKVYELPSGYWRAFRLLLSEEKDKNPEWYETISGYKDSARKLQNKDKEIEMADVIFVASSFTKKTLELYPGKLPPIVVIPYGFPPVNENREYSISLRNKVKLLYVGNLSQGKGLSYLFDAVNGLENYYELTIVGAGDIEHCDILKQSLNKYRYYPPMAHDRILKLMSESDIFILPSLSDGFGMVISESMSQGTPVIATERTCAPDIISNGEDGWIVKAADSVAIRDLLERLKDNKSEIVRVGKNARETARKRPWEIYQDDVANNIRIAWEKWKMGVKS